MNLVPVSVDSIRLKQPLPFHLLDKAGVLIAKKGFVIETDEGLLEVAAREGGLYIDADNNENQAPKDVQRAFVDQLQTMVREQRNIGYIAKTRLSLDALQRREAEQNLPFDWLDLQVQANHLLHDGNAQSFRDRLAHIDTVLSRQIVRNPDGALFALIYLSASETGMYSATHAMLVAVMCVLAAREVLNWPEDEVGVLFKAALTMNVAMTELQDRLSRQKAPLDAEQRARVRDHAERSAQLLAAFGIDDPVWLGAVRAHHEPTPGPLGPRDAAHRMARLIQRADMFAARLAPRMTRPPTAPAVAMQACYFDELRKVDEAGAALIKAVGIYQPGAFVRIATDEIAVVVRRGSNTSTPRVAVVLNRNGVPIVEPPTRETSAKDYRIVASVAHRDVRVQLNLERMLLLTQSGG